jgi:Flp pilus assembly protein TadG
MMFTFTLMKKFRRDENGVQLVEVALVLPILLMLMAATAEFGRFFYTYTTLAKATRTASRYLATAPVKSAEDTTAKNLVVYGSKDGSGKPVVTGLNPSNVEVVRTGGIPVLPETVSVTVKGFKYQPLFDLGKFTGKTINLNVEISPSSTMRYLLTQPTI